MPYTPPPPYSGVDVPWNGGRPLIMEDAYVEVNGVNLSCLCEEVSIAPEMKTIELTTFCGVEDYPGPIKWHFTAKFLQSFEAHGTHDALTSAWQAWDGTIATEQGCPFVVRPHAGQPISLGNPNYYGKMIPQPIAKFGGAAGTASEIDIDWTIQGEPTIDTTGAGGLAARATKEPALASSSA
jgi:hypothetical protein